MKDFIYHYIMINTMKLDKKQKILNKAKTNVEKTRGDIGKAIQAVLKNIEGLEKETDKIIRNRLRYDLSNRLEELKGLEPSPYFFRCDVIFDKDKNKKKTIYFAKFSFSKKSIFSWTAKAAVIRFEKPGRFSYKVKKNKTLSGQLLRKDQFMIVDGKIIFMASESEDYERTLIYQEKLQL